MRDNQLVRLSKSFAVSVINLCDTLKECFETDYWLEIFHNSGIVSDEEYSDLTSQCSKLRKLLIASITTAKKNAEK